MDGPSGSALPRAHAQDRPLLLRQTVTWLGKFWTKTARFRPLDHFKTFYIWIKCCQKYPEIEHVPYKNMFLLKQHLLFYLQIVREVETENKINFLTFFLTLIEIQVQKWRIKTVRSVLFLTSKLVSFWPQISTLNGSLNNVISFFLNK